MTRPGSERPEMFPDVRMGAQTALGLTAALAAIYAVIFVTFAASTHGHGLALKASFVLGASLLILSYLDLRTGLLLDVITLPLIGLGIGYALASGGSWHFAVAGAGLGYGLVAGLGLLWRRLRGYDGIGLGDAKLLAAGGAWVGAGLLPLILLIASGLGLVLAATVSKKPQDDSAPAAIAFGPPLGLGIWVAWCTGELILI